MTKRIKLLLISGSLLAVLPVALIACGQTQTTPKKEKEKPVPIVETSAEATIYTEANKDFAQSQIKDKLDVLEASFKNHSKYLKEISAMETNDVNKAAMVKLAENYEKFNEKFVENSSLKTKIAAIDKTKANYIDNLNQIKTELLTIKSAVFEYAKEYFETIQKKTLTDTEVLEALKDFSLLGVILSLLPPDVKTQFLPMDYFNLISNPNDDHSIHLQLSAKINLLKIAKNLKKEALYKIPDYSVSMIHSLITLIQQDIAIAKVMEQKVPNDKILESLEKVTKEYPTRTTTPNFSTSFIDGINNLGAKLLELKTEIEPIQTQINSTELNVEQGIKDRFAKVQNEFNNVYKSYKGTTGENSKVGIKELFTAAKTASDKLPKDKITTVAQFNDFYQNMKTLNNELDYFFRTYYFMFQEFGVLANDLIPLIQSVQALTDPKYKKLQEDLGKWVIKISHLNLEISMLLSSKDEENGQKSDGLLRLWKEVILSRSLSKMVLVQAAIDNVEDVTVEQVNWR